MDESKDEHKGESWGCLWGLIGYNSKDKYEYEFEVEYADEYRDSFRLVKNPRCAIAKLPYWILCAHVKLSRLAQQKPLSRPDAADCSF